ncbi:Vacuolar protein sorting-associated protein 41, partial [Ascosphaera aggregata]
MGKATTSTEPSTASATRRANSGSDATGGSLTPTATRHGKSQSDRALSAEAPVSGGEHEHEDGDNSDDDDGDGSEDEDSEEEDEEPWFKYHSVSKDIRSIYRNGDAASCLVTSGDKMHVISATTFEVIRSYRAHRATVTSISISPFPHSTVVSNSPAKHALGTLDEGTPSSDSASMFSTRSVGTVAGSRMTARQYATPSGTIYVASSSVEGNVCVASLLDAKDVMLRNFGRPVHTVALSPNYSRDRTFLSGGTSGSLVLTVGGRIGGKSDATILGTGLASTSGWLNSLGLTANHGKDIVLHSGEGTINAIKWSQSGKYVMWVNEEGIKVMRSNISLGTQAAELAWTRLSHIDRPTLPDWDDMAGSWKARAEWIDKDSLEPYDGSFLMNSEDADIKKLQTRPDSSQTEKLIVGWGGTIWIVDVSPTASPTVDGSTQRKRESVTVTTILRTDCIISGISLYTPSILLILAYVENDDNGDDE